MKQKQIQIFADVSQGEIVSIDESLVAQCETFGDALMLSVKHSRLRRLHDWRQGRALGFDKSTWSMIKNDKRAVHPEKIPELEKKLGNRCLSQFIWLRSNGELNCQQQFHYDEVMFAS